MKFTRIAGYKFFGFNRGEHQGKLGIWYREWAPGAKVRAGSAASSLRALQEGRCISCYVLLGTCHASAIAVGPGPR